MKPKTTPLFKKTVLRNGLTLLTERNPYVQSLAIGVWIKWGTRSEGKREAGVSHFLEHMLFKGTENRSAADIVREIEGVGGDFNAFTDRECTCFHVLLHKKDAALGAEILCDVLLNSTFDSEEIERERKVILQEIAMVEENPEELAFDLIFEKAYGKHGLGTPILGTEASIRRMKRAHLMRYFRQHYRPERTVVSVVGNISHQRVRELFSPLARKRWPERPPRPLDPKTAPRFEPAPKVREGLWWVVRPTEQVHIVWGVETPRSNHRDRVAASLLTHYLGSGMSSLLFQEIREKNGLAYSVYASQFPFIDSGFFTVYVAASLNKVPQCLRLIEETVGQLARESISDEQLETLKSNVKGTVLLSSDDVESRMSSLAKYDMFLRQHLTVKDICKAIDRVKAQDIRRVARKYFRSSRRTVLVLGPKPRMRGITKLRSWLLQPYRRT